MSVKIKKLHPDAIVPTYGTPGAACFDLYAVDCAQQSPVYAQGGTTFRTGLAFRIPDGYVMLVFSRSGHGFKNDTRLANCVGVIDSDYRGEVMVRLSCDSAQSDMLRVSPGDRIAQAMVVPVPHVVFDVVDDLPQTTRGAGGFGSTGS
jgi:dUTP pyrophosphatase